MIRLRTTDGASPEIWLKDLGTSIVLYGKGLNGVELQLLTINKTTGAIVRNSAAAGVGAPFHFDASGRVTVSEG